MNRKIRKFHSLKTSKTECEAGGREFTVVIEFKGSLSLPYTEESCSNSKIHSKIYSKIWFLEDLSNIVVSVHTKFEGWAPKM